MRDRSWQNLWWLGAALWTLVLGLSLAWNIHQLREEILVQARHQAEAALDTESAIRRFVVRMGGIYVPTDKGVTPNEHLAHLEHRDIETPVGRLTLVNSSYLIRLVDAIRHPTDGLKIRAIAARPLSEANFPDAWETAALARLTPERRTWGEKVVEDGVSWWREVRARTATAACLGCHRDPDIKVGDLLGALSVKVPLAPLETALLNRNRAILAGHLLIWLIGLAAIWGIHRAGTRWADQREQLRRQLGRELDKEKALSEILHISLSDGDFEDRLREILKRITRSPVVDLAPKGAIFLNEPGDGRLHLAVEDNLPPVLKTTCAQVAHGHCLCGKAAAEEQIVFAACVNDDHVVRYDGMQPHGHYCVPIKGEAEVLLGVLTLYVAHGHVRTEEDERFLNSAADILANMISRHRMTEELERQAFYDMVTGLPNRNQFMSRLKQRLRIEGRGDSAPSALMFLDLDGFKAVNDQLGHDRGDQLLQEVAQRLSACVRPQDIVARLGGDEFTLLLEEPADRVSAEAIAERIHQALSRPFLLGDQEVHVSASIGVTFTQSDRCTAEELIRIADLAMYQAKMQGKSCTWFFEQAR